MKTPVLSCLAAVLAQSALSDQPACATQQRGCVRDVYAVWYRVPPHSLAKRRAHADEFTAAHNRLPIGCLVRVTNLSNNKSVTVRITDRGIRDRRAKIDVCKEAAEELGFVRQGVARVRIEIATDMAVTAAGGASGTTSH